MATQQRKTMGSQGVPEYDSYTHHQHVLARPDTYVGETEATAVEGALVADDAFRLGRRDIASFSPALYKIVDEVVVNALDHWANTLKARAVAQRLRRLDISVDAASGRVTVENDGRGVPVKRLAKHGGVYAPELIFGRLLTSSNYRDDEERVTGGRNGYGVKCTNIYSTEFTVETCDGKKVYRQTWKRNMYEVGDPVIRAAGKRDRPHTRISFVPDFGRLGVPGFDADALAVLRRRAMDAAAWCRGKVAVSFNGERVGVASLGEYARAYVGERGFASYRTRDGRWECVVTSSDTGRFEQVSFVNGIATVRGGRHVDHVTKPLVKALATAIGKKEKLRVTAPAVRSQLLVFVRAVVINPAFDGQLKEKLTTPAPRFGSSCALPKDFADRVILAAPGLVELVAANARYRGTRALKKTDGSKTTSIRGIPKLCDAAWAGHRSHARECSLILTEGDSAKTMAISGLSAIKNARQTYGVYPLKGKIMNVRGASSASVAKNTELEALKRILGLKTGKVYRENMSPWPLRYGRVIVMTDQDVDGSHIKGLLANFFHTYWPSLLKIGFVSAIVTPIVKVRPRRGKGKALQFYNLGDYEEWCEKNPGYESSYHVKYYKGLGTSDSKEAREYFGPRRRFVRYTYGGECGGAIDLAFNKERSDDRKCWLEHHGEARLDARRSEVSFSEFINKELVLFSKSDVRRSIPSCVDGLKPSQRKVLYACFKRRLHNEIKVSQLAGYVSENAAYHHGEASLNGTIINMAQDFVGSNNVCLLSPSGQFGSRMLGGADAASPRYIFTCLSPYASRLFPPEDATLLPHLTDDGMKIEPNYYVPIIPTLLCNGAKGIGTGWSTSVPQHNPLDVAECVLRKIEGGESKPLTPWFRGFRGVVERLDEHTFVTRGCCQVEGKSTVRVTELPVGVWNLNYKTKIEKIIASGKHGLLDYEDRSTERRVDILLLFEPKALEALDPSNKADAFQRKFGLVSKTGTRYTNMFLFDSADRIRRFETPEQIVDEFLLARRPLYQRRFAHMLASLAAKRALADEKRRFIEAVVAGDLELRNRPMREIEADLDEQGYDPTKGGGPSEGGGRYGHLIGMPMSSMTRERIDALRKEHAVATEAYDALAKRTPQELWIEEIREFMKLYRRDSRKKKEKEI